MKQRILAIVLLFLSVFSPYLVSATSAETHSISSHGTIEYNTSGRLQVEGKRIIDENGNQVLLRGFNAWHANIFEVDGLRLTEERLQEIKDWGFNVLKAEIWWTARWAGIEQDFNQNGVYNEANLAKLETFVQRAEQVGLYVILSMRVSHVEGVPPEGQWQGWAWHDYLLTSEGLERYCNFLSMIVQRFDDYEQVIGYCPWHFPWHGDWNPPQSTKDAYYNTITPAMIDAVRTYSNKIIFYSPFHHGIATDPQGNILDAGWFLYISPITDSNVVYCHDGHRSAPSRSPDEGFRGIWDWDYDYQSVRDQYQPAIDFMNTYNVPIMLAEFGLQIHQGDTRRPIDQSRLDFTDFRLTILDEAGDYNWAYWIYGNNEVAQGVLEADLSPSAVVPVLRAHV